MARDAAHYARLSDDFWQALACRPLLSLCLYLLAAPVIELGYYLYTWRFLRVRSEQPHRTRVLEDREDVRRFWSNVLARYSGEEVDEIVRGWFLDRDEEEAHGDDERSRRDRTPPACAEPRRGNVLELLAWTLTNSDVADLEREELAEAEELLCRLEAHVGAPYKPGRAASLHCMRHTLGPLERVWKPFVFYLGCALASSRGGAGSVGSRPVKN